MEKFLLHCNSMIRLAWEELDWSQTQSEQNIIITRVSLPLPDTEEMNENLL